MGNHCGLTCLPGTRAVFERVSFPPSTNQENNTMCGIVGYVGYRDVSNFLLEGLHRLEYRGYDSAGVSTLR